MRAPIEISIGNVLIDSIPPVVRNPNEDQFEVLCQGAHADRQRAQKAAMGSVREAMTFVTGLKHYIERNTQHSILTSLRRGASVYVFTQKP